MDIYTEIVRSVAEAKIVWLLSFFFKKKVS